MTNPSPTRGGGGGGSGMYCRDLRCAAWVGTMRCAAGSAAPAPHGWHATAATPPPGRVVSAFRGARLGLRNAGISECCCVASALCCSFVGGGGHFPSAAGAARRSSLGVASFARPRFSGGVRHCDFTLHERGVRDIQGRETRRPRSFAECQGCIRGRSGSHLHAFPGASVVTCCSCNRVILLIFFLVEGWL